MKDMRRNLTEGSILKALLALAVPIIVANLFQTVYQLTDTFWVGRLGAEAVASVSLSFPIIFLIITLGGGLTIAGSILIAQYKGKNDQEKINYVAAQTLSLMLIVTIVLSIIGYFLATPFINSMNPEPTVASDAIKYLQITFAGFVFITIFFVYQSAMRGIGDVKTPLYIVIATVLLNFILDPLFILGWGPIPAYGVSGAAVATIGTEALAAIIGIILLVRGRRGIKLYLKNLKPRLAMVKKLFFIGFPTSIEQSSRALGMVFMTFLVAVFGTEIIAAYGLGGRIFSFVIIPAIGFAMSTSTIVGQNIGAGKIERAVKTMQTSTKLGFISLTGIGILMFIFATHISTAFIPNDLGVIRESAYFIRIISLSFGFIGIQMALLGTLRGSGNTTTAMKLALFAIVMQLTTAFVLSQYTSLKHEGIWWAYPISNIAGALLGLYYVLQGKWKNKKIT